jgi:hypothetical protein
MKIYSNRPEGNALYIMGQVSALLEAAGRRAEIPGVMKRMKSGDYANLCAVAEKVTFGSIHVVREDQDDEA